MKKIKNLIVLSSVFVTSLACAQNYGQYSYDQTNPNQPVHPSRSPHSYPTYRQSGQYQDRDMGYQQGGHPGYGRDYQKKYPQQDRGYQQDRRDRQQRDDGSWFDWSNDRGDRQQKDDGSWFDWSNDREDVQRVPDQVVRNQIIRNIKNTPYLSRAARNVQIQVQDGEVILRGRAANENEGMLLEYIVKNVRGVQSVNNELEYSNNQR